MSSPADKDIEINGIKFNACGWYPLADRGVVLVAELVGGEYTWDSVSKGLVGQEIEGHPIRGAEMSAVHQQTGKMIGILI